MAVEDDHSEKASSVGTGGKRDPKQKPGPGGKAAPKDKAQRTKRGGCTKLSSSFTCWQRCPDPRLKISDRQTDSQRQFITSGVLEFK